MTDPQDRPDADATPAAAAASEGAPEGTAEAASTDVEPVSPDAAAVGPTVEPAVSVDAEATPAAAAEPSRAPKRRGRDRTEKAATPAPRPLSPYAIVETGGKQYRVSVGDTLAVELLPVEAGADVTLERVLLLSGNGATRVGTPTVAGAAVTARVEDHYRGKKIVVFKYKAKKRYRRRLGHRQSLTRLTITGITGA